IRMIAPAPPTLPPGSLWVPVEGPHTRGLGEQLVRNGRLDDRESFLRVRDEAARILSQCVRPEGTDAQRTGVVIGYVQSGKTMSMTTVAALARDNRFRIVIAISGTTENLFKQSRERFQRDLRSGQQNLTPWIMVSNPTVREHGPLLQRLIT